VVFSFKVIKMLSCLRGAAAFSFCALAVLGEPAVAADADGSFAVRGLGGQSCAVLLEAVKTPQAGQVLADLSTWSSGYVTAANRSTEGFFDVMPLQDSRDVAKVIVGICRSNPDALIETAAMRLVTLVSEIALKVPSELDTIENGEFKTVIRRSVMLAAQRQLVALGLLEAEAVDGLYGPKSRIAFTRFQVDNKLAETGVPDTVTVLRLLVEKK
jgi:hypothetical protein